MGRAANPDEIRRYLTEVTAWERGIPSAVQGWSEATDGRVEYLSTYCGALFRAAAWHNPENDAWHTVIDARGPTGSALLMGTSGPIPSLEEARTNLEQHIVSVKWSWLNQLRKSGTLGQWFDEAEIAELNRLAIAHSVQIGDKRYQGGRTGE